MDVSKEFTQMLQQDFHEFVSTLDNEAELQVIADWTDKFRARALKAFLESAPDGQRRHAALRATKAQRDEERNVFGSAVVWIEVK